MFSQHEMEQAFLGGMLTVRGGTSLLDPSDFTVPLHRLAFQALQKDHWSAPEFAATIGPQGASLFASLVSQACARENLEPFAAMIRRQRQLRDIRSQALSLAQAADNPLSDPAQIANDAIARLQQLPGNANATLAGVRSVSEIMSLEMLTGSDPTVPTAIPEIDRHAHLAPGTLNIVAARPGQGKSALLLDWSVHAARHGFQVLFFSLEMSLKDLRRRLWTMFPAGPQDVASLPVWIQEPFLRRPQVGFLVAFAAEFCRTLRDRPTVVVVDYAQIVAPNRYWQTRREQVGEVVRELKAMALSLDVPVLAAAQLSRAVEQRGPKAHPQLSDLKEAGELEEVADLVCFLHRPTPSSTECVLGVAKNRHGLGHFSVRLTFRPEVARFQPLAPVDPWN